VQLFDGTPQVTDEEHEVLTRLAQGRNHGRTVSDNHVLTVSHQERFGERVFESGHGLQVPRMPRRGSQGGRRSTLLEPVLRKPERPAVLLSAGSPRTS
jgi:hypothetical protein